MPGKDVLEISIKSMQPGGATLSAFLLKYVPEFGKSVPLACVFQAGKVFQNGRSFKDLMTVSPKKEFRFIIHVPRGKKQQLIDADGYKFRPSNGLMIPYLDLNFSKDAVRGITISPTVQSDLAEKSLISFLEYCKYDINSKKDFIIRSDIPVRF